MTIDEILLLPDFKQVVGILTKETKEDRNREEYLKEFKGDRSRRGGGVDRRDDFGWHFWNGSINSNN